MVMHKALYPRGLSNIEDCNDATIQGLKEYTKKSKEGLIKAARNSNIKRNN